MSGWSVKNQTMEEPMKQKMELKNIIPITVLDLIQMQNLDLSDYLLIDYPNSKDSQFFLLQYTKKKWWKCIILVIIFFTGKK